MNLNIIKLLVNLICNITVLVLLELRFKTENYIKRAVCKIGYVICLGSLFPI